MPIVKDLVGQKFGRLTVTEFSKRQRGATAWKAFFMDADGDLAKVEAAA